MNNTVTSTWNCLLGWGEIFGGIKCIEIDVFTKDGKPKIF